VMAREWNSVWEAVIGNADPVYAARLKRMIMASINWAEGYPDADLRLQERNAKDFLRLMYLPDEADSAKIMLDAPWSLCIRPANETSQRWFDAIVAADNEGVPSVIEPTTRMMRQALSAGMLVQRVGWNEFNKLACAVAEEQR
jgi:hypothetical protein